MPAYEDEHGTYIMNSKDFRAVQHVPRMVEMGLHSLKIEALPLARVISCAFLYQSNYQEK